MALALDTERRLDHVGGQGGATSVDNGASHKAALRRLCGARYETWVSFPD